MQDYSYNELMQMQEQAIRRVKEMQKRARVSAGETLPPDEESAADENPPVSAENIGFLHEEQNESVPQSGAPVFKADNSDGGYTNGGRNAFSGLSELMERFTIDSDTALLLPLLLLLAKEGTDKKLLLALLYIMG